MTAAPADIREAHLAAPLRIVVATVLLAGAVGLLAATLDTLDQPTLAIVFASLALAAYAVGLLCLLGGRLGLSSWSFGAWTLFWYATAFGLATLTWSGPQTGTATEIAITSVLRALWLVAVGMTVWVLGYFIGPGRFMREKTNQAVRALGRHFETGVRSPLSPWILYGIGIVARLASTATTGRFGYVGDAASVVSTATAYGQALSLLSLCAPLAVSAAALRVYRERAPHARTTLIVLFAAELVFGAAAGGKQSFIITVLAVAIPFSAARNRLPRVALIGLTVVFLVIVIPFNQAYRGTVRSGSGALSVGEAIGSAPQILGQTLAGHSLLTVLPASTDFLFQRITEIDSPAIIMQRTPAQIGFLSPVQLAAGPAAELIPRALWPAKPIVAVGYQISQEYYGFSSTVYTSSAITPVGDLYRHGGWVPVVGGMFFLGCGVRLLDDVLDVRENPHAIFLVLLLFPELVKNEVDWVSLVSSIPGTIAIWVLAVALTFRKRRRA
jgi:hypothetical protein